MTRKFGRCLVVVVLTLALAAVAIAADCCKPCNSCKQWFGCGYGPGYNAPTGNGGCGPYGAYSGWGRGCCEIPANWRLRVWDGYRGDPCSYQRSLIGAAPDAVHVPNWYWWGNTGGNAGCAGGGCYSYSSPAPPIVDGPAGAMPSSRKTSPSQVAR